MKDQNYPRSQWVVVSACRALWQSSWRDATAVPRRAWKEWLVVAGTGWLLVLLLLFFMIRLMQALLDAGVLSQTREIIWLAWFNEQSPMIFSDAVWLSAPGDPIVIIPILILATVIAARMGYPLHAVTIFVSYFLVAGIVFTGWQIWDRPRPELVLNGVAAPAFHSFPSGHMAETTVVYSLFGYFWLRLASHWSERVFGILVLTIWLGLVGVARLEMGTHWITDILAGALIGLGWFGVLVVALRRAEAISKRYPAQPPPSP